jgi:hypothetical protein
MRLDHSMRFQINERSLAMFTVSRLGKSSLLVLLTATLTTAAYAGGGHSGSKASSGATGPVHANSVQSNARLVSGNGSPPMSKGPVAHPWPVRPTTPIVRDHRGLTWYGQIPNSYPCPNDCVGEGGLNGGQPAPQQPSYKPRDGVVHDHRS